MTRAFGQAPLAALVLAALAACAPAPPAARFRDPGAPIWSVAAFDPARLPGNWTQTAALAAAGAGSCPAGAGLAIGADLQASGWLCLNGAEVAVAGRLVPAGPGRLRLEGRGPGGPDAVWWIIWADEAVRTLAVATPSGAFGFVLDRSGATPPDRLAAAVELFDFNGHDRRLLRPLR